MPVDQRFRPIFEGLLAARTDAQTAIFASLAEDGLLLPFLTSLVRGVPQATNEQSAVDRVFILAVRSNAAPAQKGTRGPSFADQIRWCRDHDRGRLSPNERRFVMDACRYGFAWQPTPPQARWLSDMLARLQRRSAA